MSFISFGVQITDFLEEIPSFFARETNVLLAVVIVFLFIIFYVIFASIFSYSLKKSGKQMTRTGNIIAFCVAGITLIAFLQLNTIPLLKSLLETWKSVISFIVAIIVPLSLYYVFKSFEGVSAGGRKEKGVVSFIGVLASLILFITLISTLGFSWGSALGSIASMIIIVMIIFGLSKNIAKSSIATSRTFLSDEDIEEETYDAQYALVKSKFEECKRKIEKLPDALPDTEDIEAEDKEKMQQEYEKIKEALELLQEHCEHHMKDYKEAKEEKQTDLMKRFLSEFQDKVKTMDKYLK